MESLLRRQLKKKLSHKGDLFDFCQLVANPPGLFKLKIFGMLKHLPFQLSDFSSQRCWRQIDHFSGISSLFFGGATIFSLACFRWHAARTLQNILHAFLNALRRNAVGFIELYLLGAPALRFVHGTLHGPCDFISVKNGATA